MEKIMKVISVISRSPRISAFIAVLAGAILVPAALMAWGPDRTLYTMAHPADHVTFNSIKDNPDQGDERNFVRIREAGKGNYAQSVNIQPGKEYEVSVFYHNNASSSLNDAAHDYKGIARDTTMRVLMPSTVKAGQNAEISGFVDASNATPKSVWDTALAKASNDMALRYVAGSAVISTKGAVNGTHLSDDLINGGVKLGYDALDGNVPGCNNYEGWVTFKFKTVSPDFTIEKSVEVDGTNNFAKSVNAKAGATLQYKIKYQNTGTVTQKNVVIKDALPKGLTYVLGSTAIANSSTNGKWQSVSDNGVVSKNGLNIGDYAPGAGAYVSLKVQVAKAKALACGLNTLVNRATAETDNGNKSDTASVKVKRTCEGTPPPVTPPLPPELPKTGISGGMIAIASLGLAVTAGAYTVNSDKIRNLLRR